MRPGPAFPASRAARGALALCAGALLALPGCGSSKDEGSPIPRQQANQIIALLEQADQQASTGICRGADAKVRQAQGVLDSLPRSVDPDVRRGLADGLARLRSLISQQCQRPQQTQTQTTPTETTPTETTQTETTPTETTPTETSTTPTTTTPTTTTPTTTTPTGTETGTTPTTTTGTGGTPPGAANGAAGNNGQG
ncbi:MAG: hypothetical protein ACJ77Z_13405 [Thermoleophilaceae bacterium]